MYIRKINVLQCFLLQRCSNGVRQNSVQMSNSITLRKTAYILALMLGFTFVLAACSSDSNDTAQIIADEFVSVSGTVKDFNGTVAVADVVIEGVYSSPGDPLNPVTSTDVNGDFSLKVLNSTPVSLRATKNSFASINTARAALTANVTVDDVDMPTVAEAQAMINTAFTSMPELVNHAWLVVDIVDSGGNEVIGKTISSSSPVPPVAGDVYTLCDGTDSGGTETTGPCPSGRQGPMYIAYYDAPGEVSITVEGQKQTAPIRMGEITVLKYVVPANEFFTISGTVNVTTGTPDGVAVEAVYTVPGDSLNPVTSTDVNGNFSLQVLKNKPVYLRMTRTDLATVNTLVLELNADFAGMDISLPTLDEAQTVIDTALGAAPELGSKAWLTIDVFDGSGAEQSGVTISPTPIPDLVVYTDCDGTDSNLDVTKTCPSGRQGPMYIAYYDLTGNVRVSVNNKETQFAPLRMGEMTYLEF